MDDDRNLCDSIATMLADSHHVVDFAYEGETARLFLESSKYELIILDWSLPGDISGIDLCRYIRACDNPCPVLFLTGKTEIADIESGFSAGADDYLCKPFSTKELFARIRALLRRIPEVKSKLFSFKNLSLNSEHFSAYVGSVELKLFPREFGVLELLIRQPEETLPFDYILDRVWKNEETRELENLRQVVIRLRKKLESAGSEAGVASVYGSGYRLE